MKCLQEEGGVNDWPLPPCLRGFSSPQRHLARAKGRLPLGRQGLPTRNRPLDCWRTRLRRRRRLRPSFQPQSRRMAWQRHPRPARTAVPPARNASRFGRKCPRRSRFRGWALFSSCPRGRVITRSKTCSPDNYREKPPVYPWPPFTLDVVPFYDNNFRYLDDPDNTQTDWLDPLKRIHLGENWLLSFGGEERIRYDDEYGQPA